MRTILISISFLFSVLFSHASWAVSATSANKATQKKPPVSRPRIVTPTNTVKPVTVVEEEPAVKYGITYSARYTIQAEEQPSGARDEYYTHELIPSLSTTNHRFRVVLDFYDHFKAPQGNAWDPASFEWALNTPWTLTDYILVKPEAAAAFLLFKTETQSDNLNSFLGARVNFILNSKNTIPDLVLKYNIQFGKFNLKENSEPDATKPDGFNYFVDTRLRHRVFLGYMITEKLMPMVFFQFDSNFLHDNSVTNKFYHETFVEYAFTENISINLGVANGGGVYTGEYQDVDNLKFYNKESSEYFVQMNFSI